MIRKRYNKTHGSTFVKANHQIKSDQLRVLTDRGEMIGILSHQEAMERARAEDKDLVLVTENARPPVAKIIDLSKYKYQLQQKQADDRKKSKKQDIKEVRFSPFMGENDFLSKLNKVKSFLDKGDKVKLSLRFKGRAITKKEFGFDMIKRVISETNEIASIEIEPKLMGMNIYAQLTPAKKS